MRDQIAAYREQDDSQQVHQAAEEQVTNGNTPLYVELTDRIIPSLGLALSGPGRPRQVTDAEPVCLALAQVLLRYDDKRHWLRAAAKLIRHLFPRLLGQSEYNARLKNAAPLLEAALRWLAEQAPGSAEMLRLMDATPVPCGQSVITARRSDLAGWAGYGYCPSHSRWYWGAKLLLICTCDGTITGFGLANPKLFGEREHARQMLKDHPASRPAPGTWHRGRHRQGLSGEDTEAFFTSPDLDLTLLRPARGGTPAPGTALPACAPAPAGTLVRGPPRTARPGVSPASNTARPDDLQQG
jgi:hypothetical protein